MTVLETEPTLQVNGKGLKRTEVDGVVRWTLSQSWANTFQKCPEQARLGMHGLLPRTESDATAIGTATHTGIEAVLRHCADRHEAEAAAIDKLCELMELDNFQFVQVKTPQTAVSYLKSCVGSWYEYVYPRLGSTVSIERPFEVRLDVGMIGTEVEELWLTGTWDFEDNIHGLWDWKTTGSKPYEQWEVSRWYVQPTVYCYARSVLAGNGGDDIDYFNYAVMTKGPHVRAPQILEIERGPAHYAWLRKQLWSIVDLYKATAGGEQSWPLMDQGWWCSPKWCPVYNECKAVPM
jgi:hypothetical protein